MISHATVFVFICFINKGSFSIGVKTRKVRDKKLRYKRFVKSIHREFSLYNVNYHHIV